MVKISIVTPSFNQADFVRQTIESVLAQKYHDLEYVVIDGGSSDGSVDIISNYHDSLAYWTTEPDRGHFDALNKGFARTTGDVMAWLNSDDMYTPWCFEVVSEIFTNFPHVQWITGLQTIWNREGAMVSVARKPKNKFDYLLGRYKWIQQESVFWRRSLWEKAGGYIDENYSLMVDGELWSRFFRHADLYHVDCVLGGYRKHGANRAQLHSNACDLEMEKAISGLRSQIDGPAREVLDASDAASSRKGRLERVRQLFQPKRKTNVNLIEAAAYKRIFWDNFKWTEGTLPFAI